MGFWSKLGNTISGAIDNNKQQIVMYMKQYQYYPQDELEKIKHSSNYNAQQRIAADNLLNGRTPESFED